MMLLAFILSCLTGGLAALHLMWAIGFWAPIRDEARLARTFVGWRGITQMPGALPFAMAGTALIGAALLPHRPEFPGHQTWLIVFALAFAARGSAAYVPAWRTLAPEQPFATLDQRLYGPLYLALAIGYGALAFGEF